MTALLKLRTLYLLF